MNLWTEVVFLPLESSNCVFHGLLNPEWGSFTSWLCPHKITIWKFIILISLFSLPLSLLGFSPFTFLLCLSSWYPWSSPSILGFSELARLHGWVFLLVLVSLCQKLSMLVIYDLSPHGLLGADEVCGDHVMVAANYQACCCWRSLSMLVTVAVVQATLQFYVLFVLFFLVCKFGEFLST